MTKFLYLYYCYSIDRPSGEDVTFSHDFALTTPFAACLKRASHNMAAGIKRAGRRDLLTIDEGCGMFHREIHASGDMFTRLLNDPDCGPTLAAASSRVDYFEPGRQASWLVRTPASGIFDGMDVRVMARPAPRDIIPTLAGVPILS